MVDHTLAHEGGIRKVLARIALFTGLPQNYPQFLLLNPRQAGEKRRKKLKEMCEECIIQKRKISSTDGIQPLANQARALPLCYTGRGSKSYPMQESTLTPKWARS